MLLVRRIRTDKMLRPQDGKIQPSGRARDAIVSVDYCYRFRSTASAFATDNPSLHEVFDDADGLCDAGDPCPLPCVWDIDLSGDVRVPDLIKLLSCWGPLTGDPDCACLDIDMSGDVRVPDLIAMLAVWGVCS